MVFTIAPFNQYTTTIEDKTFEHMIWLYTEYLPRKVLQLDERNTLKSLFRIREPYCVKS